MKKIKGVFTALATPFKNNKVDLDSLDMLVDFQLQNGINGFVINGTTAESPTLEWEEVKQVFNLVKKKSGNEKTIILGAGSNSTEKAKKLAKESEKLGADAILSVVPYYNKPTQYGLLEHFKAIADSSNLPLILYNVPTRTITALELNTIKKLADHPQIVGIKEASGNMAFAKQIRETCGSEFVLLSGDDGSYEDFMEVGGDGIISVGSHIIPEAFCKRKIKANKNLIEHLYIESNPIPVKMALYLMGIISSPELRLPLTTMSEENTKKLKEALRERNLIK